MKPAGDGVVVAMSVTDDNEVPGKMDSSSETPYMRRSRAVTVRRSRVPQSFRRVAWWAGVFVFVLLPLGAGGYLLRSYLRNSPRFQVASASDVLVKGNRYVSKGEILAALGVTADASGMKPNVFSSSLKGEVRDVESIPWVQSATVVRSFPHRLVVYVAERTPIAFVDVGGQVKMVDAHGMLLDPPEKSHFDFPIVKGLDFEGGLGGRVERLHLYQEFIRETAGKMSDSGWMVSEVDLGDASNLKALLVQGGQTLLVYFGHEDFRARFENLVTVLPRLRKTNARIDSVDLRYRDQVVVNPVGMDAESSVSTGSGITRKAKGT